MKRLILANVGWNALFVDMALLEMSGATSVHEGLPPSLKWWWLIALAGGNLVIHVFMARKATDDKYAQNAIRLENNNLHTVLSERNAEIRRKQSTENRLVRQLFDLGQAHTAACKRGNDAQVQSDRQAPDPTDPAPGPDRPGGP